MTVSKSNGGKPPNLNFHSMTFKQSVQVKYVGVILYKYLNFKPNVKKLKQNFIQFFQTLNGFVNFWVKN